MKHEGQGWKHQMPRSEDGFIEISIMVPQPQVNCMCSVCTCPVCTHVRECECGYRPATVSAWRSGNNCGYFSSVCTFFETGSLCGCLWMPIAGPWPSMDSPSSTPHPVMSHTHWAYNLLSSPSFRFWRFKLRSSYLQNNCFTHRPISPDDIYLLYVLISEHCHECCENCEPDFFTLRDFRLTLQSNRAQWPFQDSP